jgi:hypothetical protein
LQLISRATCEPGRLCGCFLLTKSMHIGQSLLCFVLTFCTGNAKASTVLKVSTVCRPLVDHAHHVCIVCRDLEYIKAGRYKLPWDMTGFPAHRQFNPLYMARM